MDNEEKAKEILDCENCKKQLFIGGVKCPPACADYNDLMKMAQWKDEQMIEKACELYRKELVSLNNLLVAYDKEAFANWLMIDDSVVDFRNTLKKAIKEEQND